MSYIQKTFSKEEYLVTYTVGAQQHDHRLDQFLSQHFISFSREQIKRKIESGDIEIMKRPGKLKPSTKVKEGETVAIKTTRGSFEDEYWNGQKIELEEEIEVIKETSDYMVINKPAFMATHPTGKHLFYCATIYLSALYNESFSSVHRLDRETSGTLILAKNPTSAQAITSLFENKKIQKIYFFIAERKKENQFPIIAKERMGHSEESQVNLFIQSFPENSGKGKSAETRFELIWEDDQYLLGLALPRTGRQHQIRVHAAAHGFPLLGDKLYNGDPTIFQRFKDQKLQPDDYAKMKIPRQALHALGLKVPAPLDQIFISNLPKDLQNWMTSNLRVDIVQIKQRVQEKLQEVFY